MNRSAFRLATGPVRWCSPGAGCLALIAIVAVFCWPDGNAPKQDSLASAVEERGAMQILSHNGTLLRAIVNADGMHQRRRPLAQIGILVRQATIAAEDQRFYAHPGIDLWGVGRAVWQNVSAGQVVSGASTLSMQLARLLAKDQDRGFRAKLRQAVGALRLEWRYGKDELLERYLNRAPYGARMMGVEAASHHYFGKPTIALSLAESALLAGLPKAPSRLNPRRQPQAARRRRSYVLGRMRALGFIDESAYRRARRAPVRLVPPDGLPEAMHFTEWVRKASPSTTTVRTSLDLELQREVQALVRAQVERQRAVGVTQAAALVLENHNCAVRAWVGSADYWGREEGATDAVLAPRQPGSALKPFTYALAFEGPLSPHSVVADVELQYGAALARRYVPRNYNDKFRGPVTMAEALAHSLNIPALRVAERLGGETLLQALRRFGFRSLRRGAAHYGLGLTLGNGEVTPLEVAEAYAMLARGGLACRATGRAGFMVGPSQRVLEERTAYLVRAILEDEQRRSEAFGPHNALMLGFPVAAKTGTSSNWRDNWAAGYTARFTVVAWAGRFDGRPLNQSSGARGAGPLFAEIFRALRRRAPEPPASPPPPGVVSVRVCPASGHRPGPDCPHVDWVSVREDRVPESVCRRHRRVAIDVRNGLRASSKCPSAHVRTESFLFLPPLYARWLARSGLGPPRRYSPLCPERGVAAMAVTITAPRPSEAFVIEPGYNRSHQSLALEVEVDPPVDLVEWRVDGRTIDRAEWPYSGRWRLEPGVHELVAVAGARRSAPVQITVR